MPDDEVDEVLVLKDLTAVVYFLSSPFDLVLCKRESMACVVFAVYLWQSDRVYEDVLVISTWS